MQVVLKKDGWYCKLQEFVFGRDRSDFNNLCPFFWLTIFCIMASPFVLAVRPLKYLGRLIVLIFDKAIPFVFNKMEKVILYIEERYCNPFFENQISQYAQDMTDQDAYNLFFFMYGWQREYDTDDGIGISDRLWRTKEYLLLKQKKGNKYLDRFNRWKDLMGDSWEKNIKAIREKEKAKSIKLWKEKEDLRAEKEKQKALIEGAKREKTMGKGRTKSYRSSSS